MTHPTPSTMARLAYPDEPTMTARERAEASEARSHYAAGAAAERSRIVAGIKREAAVLLARGHEMDIAAAVALEAYAAQLEGAP